MENESTTIIENGWMILSFLQVVIIYLLFQYGKVYNMCMSTYEWLQTVETKEYDKDDLNSYLSIVNHRNKFTPLKVMAVTFINGIMLYSIGAGDPGTLLKIICAGANASIFVGIYSNDKIMANITRVVSDIVFEDLSGNLKKEKKDDD